MRDFNGGWSRRPMNVMNNANNQKNTAVVEKTMVEVAKGYVTPKNVGKATVCAVAVYGAYKLFKEVKNKFFTKNEETKTEQIAQ